MFLMKCQTTDIFDGMEAILWRKKKKQTSTHESETDLQNQLCTWSSSEMIEPIKLISCYKLHIYKMTYNIKYVFQLPLQSNWTRLSTRKLAGENRGNIRENIKYKLY